MSSKSSIGQNGHNNNNQLYKSRKTIIEFLKIQGYDVSNYDNFSIHEVHSIYQSKQLDMLFTNTVSNNKTYVKYHLGPNSNTLRPQNIYEIIEDLFNLEEILSKKDNLVIITKDHPNDSLIKVLQTIWEQDKIFITVFGIERLQYSVLNHELVPPHTVLTSIEEHEMKQKYFITNPQVQLPDISRFSPVAQAIGLRPDQICKIIRPSKTAINTVFYRICLN
jgi:DNA-directed RNA polymerase subunit H (RpoH/RPB5)